MEYTFYKISEELESFSPKQFIEFLQNTFPKAADDKLFEHKATVIFNHYSSPGGMLKHDFSFLWSELLERCIKPKTALVVVDFQNDFIDGSLATKNYPLQHDAAELLPRVNKLIDTFDEVVYTYDWHPENHISFIDNRHLRELHQSNFISPKEVRVIEELIFNVNGDPVVQQMWPRHCVQNSEGAKLHKDLKIKENSIVIYKGLNPDVDSYSAFYDNARQSQTELKDKLNDRNITNIVVVGLAFDACVLATALDALHEGFTSCIVGDATAGICESSSILAANRCQQNSLPVISCDKVNMNLMKGPLPWVFVWQQGRQLLVRSN